MNIFSDSFKKEAPLLGLQGSGGGLGYLSGGASAADPVYVEDVFSTYLYEGTGSTQTITNGIDLAGEGGMVWIKNRFNGGSFTNNTIVDSERIGSNGHKSLYTNLTDGQFDPAAGQAVVTSFSSNGFTRGGNANVTNGDNVAWTFRKAPKFFDAVTWTGDGVNGRQISHSLGSTPGVIIIKRTSAGSSENWVVYHRSLGIGQNLTLNEAYAANSFAYVTALNSNTFSVSNQFQTNGSSETYVAYLFAHDAGGFGDDGTESVIKCGSFSSTGFVDLGFEPQWVMIKSTSNTSAYTGDWRIFDNMRGIVSGDGDAALYANEPRDENTTSFATAIALNATGFTVEGQGNYGTSTIYIAIRRGPMKTPEDATTVFNVTSVQATSVTTGFPVDTLIARWQALDTYTAAISRLTGIEAGRTDGITNFLKVNTTDPETTGNVITENWNNTGFNTGNAYNGSPTIYWSFRRAPSFFDVVTWTGSGSDQNVNHNLKVIPEMVITKMRDYSGASTTYGGDRWYVYHKDLGGSGVSAYDSVLGLNESGGQISSSNGGIFSSAPTSTILPFSNPGYDSLAVTGASDTYVGYLFASCPGVSKVGSYAGSASDIDVNCGFTNGARFVLIKRIDTTGDWCVFDTARGIVSGNDPVLKLNSTSGQDTGNDLIDPISSGFRVVGGNSFVNNSNAGASYIFLAIA